MENKEIAFLSGPCDRLPVKPPRHFTSSLVCLIFVCIIIWLQWLMAECNQFLTIESTGYLQLLQVRVFLNMNNCAIWVCIHSGFFTMTGRKGIYFRVMLFIQIVLRKLPWNVHKVSGSESLSLRLHSWWKSRNAAVSSAPFKIRRNVIKSNIFIWLRLYINQCN